MHILLGADPDIIEWRYSGRAYDISFEDWIEERNQKAATDSQIYNLESKNRQLQKELKALEAQEENRKKQAANALMDSRFNVAEKYLQTYKYPKNYIDSSDINYERHYDRVWVKLYFAYTLEELLEYYDEEEAKEYFNTGKQYTRILYINFKRGSKIIESSTIDEEAQDAI